MRPKPILVRLLWAAVILLVAIGIGAVLRRMFHLSPSPPPPGFPEAAILDRGPLEHPLLTLVHIVPGLLFIVLGPLQFIRRLRNRRPRFHRWAGRVFVGSGAILGLTALIMSPVMPAGGVNETVASTLFAILFLFALSKTFLHIRRREVIPHREWMIRAFAIGLAVATIRPIVGVFFATKLLTHLTPRESFGTAFWLAFTLHLIAAELWINYTRASGRRAVVSATA